MQNSYFILSCIFSRRTKRSNQSILWRKKGPQPIERHANSISSWLINHHWKSSVVLRILLSGALGTESSAFNVIYLNVLALINLAMFTGVITSTIRCNACWPLKKGPNQHLQMLRWTDPQIFSMISVFIHTRKVKDLMKTKGILICPSKNFSSSDLERKKTNAIFLCDN